MTKVSTTATKIMDREIENIEFINKVLLEEGFVQMKLHHTLSAQDSLLKLEGMQSMLQALTGTTYRADEIRRL